MSIFPNHKGNEEPFSQQVTWARLVECYGYQRAQLICQGRDPQTNADIAAWRALGRRRAA